MLFGDNFFVVVLICFKFFCDVFDFFIFLWSCFLLCLNVCNGCFVVEVVILSWLLFLNIIVLCVEVLKLLLFIYRIYFYGVGCGDCFFDFVISVFWFIL